MLKLNWKTWLAVFIGLQVVFGGLFAMITAQGQPTLAYWLGFAGGAFSTVWACLALVYWREVTWVKRLNTLVIATAGFGLLILLFLAVDWKPGWMTSLYGYLAVLGFLLGVNVLRLILRPGHPVLGVARTMVEESLRMGVALIFIIAMLVLLPLLPLMFGSEDRVTYMVQRFLTYSIIIVGSLLGLMTVLLAARTVSLEIATRQIHMTLTKPLGRAQYLLGKWLGIMLLNAVLLGVAGIAIYGFTMGIASNPALNDFDQYAVNREVLTARLAKSPDPIDTTWERMYGNVLLEKQMADPGRFGTERSPFALLADDAKQEIIAETYGRFYSIDGGQSQDFLITGLGEAAAAAERAIEEARQILIEEAGLTQIQSQGFIDLALAKSSDLDAETISKIPVAVRDRALGLIHREVIQLSLTPAATPKPENLNCEVYIKVNGQPVPPRASPTSPAPRSKLIVEIANEVGLPASLINDKGEMVINIAIPETKENGIEQQSVRFNYKDDLIEVFYRVGSFEGNLARALTILWLKLAFLAMVGLMAGSLLSFPVAAMLAIIVAITAAASGIINESLDSYASFAFEENTWKLISGTASKLLSQLASGDIYGAFKLLLRLIGEAFMLLIPSFGEFNTANPLSDGHVISLGTVANAALKIGLIWTGIVAVIGVVLFQRKEIARVQV